MKMKALDSFYSSETKQVHAGQEFEIENETRAKAFVAKGYAKVLDTPDAGEKKAPEPKNKVAQEPHNKAVISAKSTKGDK